MLIRHDLGIVFIHVPKCAGKQLRSLLSETSEAGSLRELWNYSYSNILHRYVDLAHLPLQDLMTLPEFSYLEHYQVLACVRNPYARLPSAVNEFYRQRSKEDERIIAIGAVTDAMKEHYYERLSTGHSEQDPRFIHSLPIHRFTHLGAQPKVDFLLRCESLRTDFLALAERLAWPTRMHDLAQQTLRDGTEQSLATNLTPHEVNLANQLYAVDFQTFDYPMIGVPSSKNSSGTADPANIRHLHSAASVTWHWGPAATNTFPSALQPCR